MPPSKPRYRKPEKGESAPKPRPLVLKKTSHTRFVGNLIFRWVVLYTLLPLLVLWIGNLFLNPYRIYFDARPEGVTLDGKAITLDSANGFDFSRFSPGDHLLGYVNAGGNAKLVLMHARLTDENGELAVTESHVSGVPKSEFVSGR